ncbi:MAG: hemolysin family protein [Chlamydiales bacterium]|nr:hemolysin family protein [Chlamydiales bacterium]
MMIIYLQLAAILLLTLASAFFSCSEVAFFSLPASKIRSFRNQKNARMQQVARILSRSKSLLVTIFMYNTMANVLLQNATSDLFAASGGWVLRVGVPLVLVLFVGELIPKYLGLIHNEKLALTFAPVIEWLEWIITPLRTIITRVAFMLSRLFFFFLKAEPALSKDELQHILQSSEGKGILHKDEAELIYSILSLENKQVNEIMRTRSDMPIYNIEEPLSKLIHLFSEEMLSEVALFEMPQEKMLGVIRARDFFIKRDSIHAGKDLRQIMRKAFFVPETISAGILLQQLRGKYTDSAWVVDEYGTICGMITEQDLLSELIVSDTPRENEKPDFERLSNSTIVARGIMSLDDVRELFHVKLPSEHHMVTIGGYVTEKLGTIPAVGSTFDEENLTFRILSSDNKKVNKVHIQMRETT